jgi:hypothetical protein
MVVEELRVQREPHIPRHPADMEAIYTWEWLIARSG